MANKVVLLGDIIEDSKSGDILGISDRRKIIRYVERALELAEYKTTWSRYVGDLNICADCNGIVTLPSFVDTVLSTNVNGSPSYPRNGWFEYHINGPGSHRGNCGPVCGYNFADDLGWTPTFQDLKQFSLIGAICEDPADGNGSLSLRVMGETVDVNYNQKDVLTIPTNPTVASEQGVVVPLLFGYAAMDNAKTMFKRITRVIKPVTRGYIKLIAYNPSQLAQAVTIGYYAPWETNPSYRRIRVSQKCASVRVRYRRSDVPLKEDYDIIPLPSRQATLDLLKAIRLRETNNIDVAEAYEQKALQLLNDIQQLEEPFSFNLQVDPGYGVGTIDLR